MGFGQKAAFHDGVAQACAQQVALVHGKQRAQALVACTGGVFPRLPHHFHAAHAEFGGNNHQRGNGNHDANRAPKPFHRHVGKIKQADKDAEDNDGGA